MRAAGPATQRMIALASEGGGALSGIRIDNRRPGRWSVSTMGIDPYLQLIGGDPWQSPSYTGLQVPAAATTSAQGRYLFQLARARLQPGECVRLVGMKQYVDLAAIYTVVDGPSTVFTLPVTNPLWRFPDGNISWHVRIVTPGWRDTRSSTNTDSVIFRDSSSCALLYETLGPYVPPNAGRPYGKPLPYGDLGNFHDLRYPWRDSQSERELDIPILGPADIVAYCSVWQSAGFYSTNGGFASQLTTAQAAALLPEDRFAIFLSANPGVTQPPLYNRVAAQLTFEEEKRP